MERDVILVSLFAALIAALGLFPAISVGSAVPITAQSLGVMLCGAFLGARRGALATLVFLGLVALGVPLLAGGRGGLGVLTGPAIGYFIGFPVVAFVIGSICALPNGLGTFVRVFTACLIGGVFLLAGFGIAGFVMRANLGLWPAIVEAGKYIPGDIIKAGFAGMIVASVVEARPDRFQKRNFL